jgi:hypothetical protein
MVTGEMWTSFLFPDDRQWECSKSFDLRPDLFRARSNCPGSHSCNGNWQNARTQEFVSWKRARHREVDVVQPIPDARSLVCVAKFPTAWEHGVHRLKSHPRSLATRFRWSNCGRQHDHMAITAPLLTMASYSNIICQVAVCLAQE